MKLFEQIRQFANGAEIIRDWLGDGAEIVPQDEAQRRADICIGCEFNVHGLKLTDTVATAIKETVEIKNHLQLRVRGEKSLGQCAICSCVCRLQIWCPVAYLNKYATEEDRAKYPGHCWKRG